MTTSSDRARSLTAQAAWEALDQVEAYLCHTPCQDFAVATAVSLTLRLRAHLRLIEDAEAGREPGH